jgi:hypothetical protein
VFAGRRFVTGFQFFEAQGRALLQGVQESKKVAYFWRAILTRSNLGVAEQCYLQL